MDLKNVRRGRIEEYADQFKSAVFTPLDPQARPQPAVGPSRRECAFPSATQNEINGKDAANLLNNGVYVVCEGANMPTMLDGVEQFVEAGILYGPGKAANAGGVAISGLEMAQNSMASPGRAKRSTRACTNHEVHPRQVRRPPSSTAPPATTSTARTSRASSRWRTRCSIRDSSDPGTSEDRTTSAVRGFAAGTRFGYRHRVGIEKVAPTPGRSRETVPLYMREQATRTLGHHLSIPFL